MLLTPNLSNSSWATLTFINLRGFSIGIGRNFSGKGGFGIGIGTFETFGISQHLGTFSCQNFGSLFC
jgi:hypothetical protein